MIDSPIDMSRVTVSSDGIMSAFPNDIAAIVGKRAAAAWQKVQAIGEGSYADEGPVGNFSHETYPVGIDFGNYIKERGSGMALDIGCGLLGEPVYMQINRNNYEFIGIDPFAPDERQKHNELYTTRPFTFIRAIGEHLPFYDERFDAVLFCSTIDHQISPNKALSEAYRVLKPKGHLFICETMRPDNSQYRSWRLRRLLNFGYAEYNKFHNWAFNPKTLTALLEKKGFSVTDYRSSIHDKNEGFFHAVKN